MVSHLSPSLLQGLGKAERRERSINRTWTGKNICIGHYASDYYRNIEKNDPNSRNNALRTVRDRRTGNQDPNSTNAKGDRGEELLCIWEEYTNLNKKNDNYSLGTRIDCLDEKTGEYYQVKIAYYNSISKCWDQDFKKLQNSIIRGHWYEQITDKEELKRINEIWKGDNFKHMA